MVIIEVPLVKYTGKSTCIRAGAMMPDFKGLDPHSFGAWNIAHMSDEKTQIVEVSEQGEAWAKKFKALGGKVIAVLDKEQV
jgi:hypothetical protein